MIKRGMFLTGVDRILITSRYTFFSENSSTKSSGVNRVWPEAILEWLSDR
jgi:hypothetical protein